MKFDNAKEMLDYINDNHDLYSETAKKYVFNYNESGSICTYDIDEDEAYELAKNAKKASEYWGALLGTGGKIFDDPSYEDYQQEQMSNLECCEELIKYGDWLHTEEYLGWRKHRTVYRDIPQQLCSKYDYYDTVAFEFVIDAVVNTVKDFNGEIRSLDEIHKHIIENYI